MTSRTRGWSSDYSIRKAVITPSRIGTMLPYIPGVLSHQPVVLSDEGREAGKALPIGSGCDAPTPDRLSHSHKPPAGCDPAPRGAVRGGADAVPAWPRLAMTRRRSAHAPKPQPFDPANLWPPLHRPRRNGEPAARGKPGLDHDPATAAHQTDRSPAPTEPRQTATYATA